MLVGVASTSSSSSMYSSACSSVILRAGLRMMFSSEPVVRMLLSFLALVHRLGGVDEKGGALLEVVHGVGVGAAAGVADHDAVRAARHLAAGRGVLVEVVVHDRGALRRGEHARPQADQAAGGDGELQV